jgi:uncharacterized membrane protein YfcA
MISDPWFYAAAIPAVIILGLSKGGFAGIGTLATPIVALAVPPVQAASILLPILVVQDLYSIYVYRRHWDPFNLRALMPGACIGVFAAPRQLMSRSAASGLIERPRVALGWFWGALSGFTSMISHAGGPPFQIYVMPQRLESRVFVGTSVLFFAVVNWTKVPPYLALGQFSPANLATSAVLFPLALAATWFGVVLVQHFSNERFYITVYVLMVLIGVKLVIDGFA